MLRGNHPLLQSRLAFPCMENQSRSVSLLQNDEEIETREQNLEKAKRKYQLEQKTFKLTEDERNQVSLVRCSTVGECVRNSRIFSLNRFKKIKKK